MKKLLCPQCKITALYVKNEKGDILPVYVNENGEIIIKNPEANTFGYDFSVVYCLGCSWSGSPQQLAKHQIKKGWNS